MSMHCLNISPITKVLWEKLYVPQSQSAPSLCGHLICSGSTQRGHVLSSQCLLKTSLGSSWHRQDTTALSTRTRLPLSPWSFFHSSVFYPSCSASFSHSCCSLSSQTSSCPASSCLLDKCDITSVVCSLCLVLSFSLSCWSLFSARSCGRHCGGCVVVHCLQF